MLLFPSLLGNEEPITSYELHIGVKDSVFFGSNDRLIGVAVMQLKDIQQQVNFWTQVITVKAMNE